MKNHTEELIRSMFAGDAEQVENHLNRLLEKYVSIRDFTTNAPKENYYHGFMNGLLINGCSLIREQKSNFESGNEIREQESNFESGNGYIDLIVKAQDSRHTIVIIEIQQTGDEDQTDSIAVSAIEQIVDKKYAEPYVQRDKIKDVFAYGLCFCRCLRAMFLQERMQCCIEKTKVKSSTVPLVN